MAEDNHVLSQVYELVEKEKDKIKADLSSIVSQPSVSAANLGVVECANLIKSLLQRDGFQTRFLETRTGRPAVYAEKGDSEKSILFYNHYDVQPPEPLDQWVTKPFELVEKEGVFYGRGVADNKGEIIARLAAVRIVEKLLGRLPVTVKWFIEGEEEVGSPCIPELLSEHGNLLKGCMGCLWEGGDVVNDTPVFYLGVKGMLYVELSVKTAESDAHSMYAPVLENAAEKLARTLLRLKDRRGRVTVKGFYRDVLKPTKLERKLMSSAKLQLEDLAQALGVKKLAAKKSDVVEKLVFEPTCNIAGIVSGYTGPGSKTIVPSTASVKIDFRLVPNQDPNKILNSLKRMLHGVDIAVHTVAYPSRISFNERIVKIAVRAAEEVYRKPPRILPNMFGTGPLYHFTKLGIPTGLLSAIYHPGSKLHAPNENIIADHFWKAVAHHAMVLTKAGEPVS
ncbi:MAG: M20/M25/M40 family metallo-hydrolase [Candidatus Caldarchaeum sp.]